MAKKRTPQFASATVTANSHDGRGIAHIDGKLVFIDGALATETVNFQYTRRRTNFDEGQVSEVISASPQRQAPACAHFGTCGGCQLQHASTGWQLKQKQEALLEQLAHQAKVIPSEVLAPISAKDWGYRRKARLGVKYVAGKNKVLVGFREHNARFIANLTSCPILHPSIGQKLTSISDALYQLHCRDKIAQIEVAVDDQETALILRNLVTLPEQDIQLLREFAKQHHYKLYLQPKGIDSVYLLYPIDGNENLSYQLKEQSLTFHFHPTEFTQINSEINQKMVTQVLQLLALKPNDKVLDLFCGIGNFTLPIAKYSNSVIGVEGSDNAVSRAIDNAKHNQLNNVAFYCDNLFEPPFKAWSQQRYDKLVLDPPRSGAKEVIASLATWQPQKIVYISCNPATLARDTQLIIQQGYALKKAGIANMFPHTKHVEAITLFEKIT